MRADVVIIGAGLAGLSAASEIAARTRASILILERKAVGSNNPTPMTFADVPERFGLQEAVIGCYDRFTFHSPLGSRSTHAFDKVRLVGLAYQKACQILAERAEAAGEAWVYSGAASRLIRDGDEWCVRVNDGQRIRTKLVIDASGRGLFSSRALGLPRPRVFSHCYGARLSNVCLPNPQEAFFLAPSRVYGDGGGWLYPLNGNQVSFGIATLGKDPVLPGKQLKDNFRRALEGFEPYASWLKDADWEHVETGSIPVYPLRKLVYDGLLIAGDSAGQATIWSVMGSEAALTAGQMVGEAAAQALEKGDFSHRTLAAYQQNWDRRFRRTYRNNGWIAPVVWRMSEAEWNRQIPRVQSLTSEQMVERLRVNWPVPNAAQAAFVRAYDWAGRMRRKIMGARKG